MNPAAKEPRRKGAPRQMHERLQRMEKQLRRLDEQIRQLKETKQRMERW